MSTARYFILKARLSWRQICCTPGSMCLKMCMAKYQCSALINKLQILIIQVFRTIINIYHREIISSIEAAFVQYGLHGMANFKCMTL